VRSGDLTPAEIEDLRALFDSAWSGKGGTFDDEDWAHTFGGVHFLAEGAGRIVAHASVVRRRLTAGGRIMRSGYVEAVATLPEHQRQGLASALMTEVTAHIRGTYELGALDTGMQGFYERFGWRVWEGPTSVATESGEVVPTPEEDGYVMVLLPSALAHTDLTGPLVCDWRLGDVW
jgi:aminoglycoside 2'-N-acetyltransferase I